MAGVNAGALDCGAAVPASIDILDVVEPSAQMKSEMRMAIKSPSEWLRLLCRDWSIENEAIVAGTDLRFRQYKSYLKGLLTSQLLCRLSISGSEGVQEMASPMARSQASIDFWKILGVDDEFDRAHIVANIERFCSLYNIRGGTLDDLPHSPPMLGNGFLSDGLHDTAEATAAAAAAAGMGVGANCALLIPVDPNSATSVVSQTNKTQTSGKKTRQTTNPVTNEQRRLKAELREREREAYAVRKAAEKATRLAAREERRQRKLAMRKQREEIAQQQKEAALRRAAELVQSNRVPIEITRGAIAAQAAVNVAVANAAAPVAGALSLTPATPNIPVKKGRSSIVISTASDLEQIVTHANNLWAKYNAIAKEHKKKVNWNVVAKELGIHVKVREKYARMHARAKARGFDFDSWGHYRIKDYPQYFLDPLGPTSVPEPVHVPAKREELGKQALGAAPQLQQQRSLPLTAALPLRHNPLTTVAETAEAVGGNPTYLGNSAVVEAVGAEVPSDETRKLGTSHSGDEAPPNFGGTTPV